MFISCYAMLILDKCIYYYSHQWSIMPMSKQYLRVAPGPVFGVVASHKCNILALTSDSSPTSNLCAVGACENVYVWDLNRKEKVDTHLLELFTKTPLIQIWTYSTALLQLNWIVDLTAIFKQIVEESFVDIHNNDTDLSFRLQTDRYPVLKKIKKLVIMDIVS